MFLSGSFTAFTMTSAPIYVLEYPAYDAEISTFPRYCSSSTMPSGTTIFPVNAAYDELMSTTSDFAFSVSSIVVPPSVAVA